MIGFSTTPMERVRVGFIGLGSRGAAALERYARLDGVEISALCDIDCGAITAVKDRISGCDVETYSGQTGWEDLCRSEEVDLVYICTDWQSHTMIACHAMECGKHVAVEVPAATSIKECWQLVRTSEATRRHCFMLENCIYDVFEQSTYSMVQDGVFGQIYHAEGGYVHQLPYLTEWRSQFNIQHKGDNYPTHGFGPLCRILGIHRSDYLKDITSYTTEIPGGNHIISIIRTVKGKNIILQHNIVAARPYSRLYQFTGEKGYAAKYPTPIISLLPDADKWLDQSKMSELVERYLPDYYSHVRAIMPSGLDQRRFMDYAMDYRLIYCLRNGLPLDIDVYDAAEWSSISELSHVSIEHGSIPISFPDFLKK